MVSRGLILALCSVAYIVVACDDDDDNPTGPDVSLQRDFFRFEAVDLDSLTDTLTYEWENTGTAASVEQDPGITSGVAMLTLLDADSVQVYTRNLADSGAFSTSTGMPGVWIATVIATDLSGELSFEAHKAP